MPRKRRKNRFRNHLLTFLFICIIFLLFYAFKNPILLYSSNPVIEINQDYDPSSNIQQVFYHADSDVKISGNVNTAKVGEYTITYQLNNYKKTCIISVKDTGTCIEGEILQNRFSRGCKAGSFCEKCKR